MSVLSEKFIDLDYSRISPAESVARGRAFYEMMQRRRSVRDFSPAVPPRECIDWAIRAAGTSPSGAHRQPWRFVVVDDPELKRAIRQAAETEERESYEHRFPREWLDALAPLGTDWHKPFLQVAPYLVVVFKESSGRDAQGRRVTNYYVNESVGIACGIFIAAIHAMGLVTLTHTPNPMGFLSRLLKRPPNEKPFILFPVGYPAEGAKVPNLTRKSLDDLVQLNDGAPPRPTDAPSTTTDPS
jgi:iodotyrosine deiodinase